MSLEKYARQAERSMIENGVSFLAKTAMDVVAEVSDLEEKYIEKSKEAVLKTFVCGGNNEQV